MVAGGIGPIYFYTAANGTVWTKTETGAATQVSNGRVVGAVSGLYNGSRIILFGRGTDHALWYTTGTGISWSSWASLGGSITAQPGAVYRGSAAVYAVLRARQRRGRGPRPQLGRVGRLALRGRRPVRRHRAVRGLPRQHHVGPGDRHQQAALHRGGGLDRLEPGRRPDDRHSRADHGAGALVGFVRHERVAYFHRFLNTSPGWAPMGGLFTSGLGAANAAIGGTLTFTVGLGTNRRVYFDGGNWSFGLPAALLRLEPDHLTPVAG